MSLWEEMYSGFIIGLCMSLKSLLSQFPDKKLAFAICTYAFYVIIGGLWAGSLKILIGFLTFLLSARFDLVFNVLWGGFAAAANRLLWGSRGRRHNKWWWRMWDLIVQ